jgi:hypothetical protein
VLDKLINRILKLERKSVSFRIICLVFIFLIVHPTLASSSSAIYINHSYDASGRLSCTYSRSEKLCYNYDLQGNLLSKINENSVNGDYNYKESSSAIAAYGNQQGNDNWFYQEWNGLQYSNLIYKNGRWEGSSPYTLITRDNQHPSKMDSVRKWVAPRTGLIWIAGNVAKSDISGGDGVTAKILKNRIQLWSRMLAYNDSIGYEMGISVAVQKGDAIYFTINQNANNAYDSTRWNPSIAYIESESAYEAFGNIQGIGGWYFQQWDGIKYTDLKYMNGLWIGSSSQFPLINSFIQHPSEIDAVRKWVAPKKGFIRIAGNVAKSDTTGGDGVSATVLKNKFQLWSQTLAYNDSIGYEVGITVAVQPGDSIYFVVNQNSNMDYDSTSWTPIIAYMDSVSASEAFGNTQGSQNWYYQQWDGAKYSDLKYMNGRWVGSNSSTLIFKDIQHPSEADSVRKWVAPKNGRIRIAGNVKKSDVSGGDGVIAKILQNKTQLWSQKLAYNDAIGYEVGVTLEVNTGDSIYFVIKQNGNNAYDSTSWDPFIAYLK